MFMNSTELVELIGVYVEDFLVAGCDDDPFFLSKLFCQNLKGLSNGERVESGPLHTDQH